MTGLCKHKYDGTWSKKVSDRTSVVIQASLISLGPPALHQAFTCVTHSLSLKAFHGECLEVTSAICAQAIQHLVQPVCGHHVMLESILLLQLLHQVDVLIHGILFALA